MAVPPPVNQPRTVGGPHLSTLQRDQKQVGAVVGTGTAAGPGMVVGAVPGVAATSNVTSDRQDVAQILASLSGFMQDKPEAS